MLSTDIATSVIGQWEQVGVVCQAIKDVFTTGSFDNIDYTSLLQLQDQPFMEHASAFTNTFHLTHQWRELSISSINLKWVRKLLGLCQPATQQLIWTPRYLMMQLYMSLLMEPTVIIFQLRVLSTTSYRKDTHGWKK